MPHGKQFSWTLAPLLDEARIALEECEDRLQAANRAAEARASELRKAHLLLEQAVRDEHASVRDISLAIRNRLSLAERQRVEQAALRAKHASLRRSLEVEAAGERLVRAEEDRLAARETRDDADVAVKELLRLRGRAEAEHRRTMDRNEERRLEEEAMDHWRPARGGEPSPAA